MRIPAKFLAVGFAAALLLATLGAFLYNLIADVVGGIELLVTERE